MFQLDQFRASIAHKTEIRESNRGDYTVFDYVVALKDTFDSLEARNARGIAFCNYTGNLVSLPYDKFHNFNECDGWRAEDIDLSQPHVILEKLDGSMIRTIRDRSELGFHFGTRAGVTDVSQQAEDFLFKQMDPALRERYVDFIHETLKGNMTAIFEYCAPSNRIVVFYAEPKLVLTAIRVNHSGEYIPYEYIVADAEKWGIPVVQPVATDHSSIGELSERVKDFVGVEGVVVRFRNGKMVKMKGLDYVRQHKALDGLRHEKDVLSLIFANQLDDILPLVSDEIRDRLVLYRDDVLMNVRKFMESITSLSNMLKQQCTTENGELDRKAYREEAQKHKRADILMSLIGPKTMPKHGNWKPFSIVEYIVGNKYIISSLRTQETVNDIRDIIGAKSWYDYGRINVGE